MTTHNTKYYLAPATGFAMVEACSHICEESETEEQFVPQEVYDDGTGWE